jgi:hypothetical protein
MAEEKRLFRRFAEEEGALAGVVQQRDWPKLESLLAGLDALAGEISAAEQRRHEEYQGLKRRLGVSERAGFGVLVSRLGRSEGAALSAAREELRGAVARVRSLTGSLAYYFRYIKESVEQILAEAFPHRRGRIYSRHGRPAQAGADPMVVNHSL